MADFGRIARGLLGGAAEAAQQIGKSRIEKEKEAARQLRAENMTRFAAGETAKRQERTIEASKEAAGLLAEQKVTTAKTKHEHDLELADFKGQLAAEAATIKAGPGRAKWENTLYTKAIAKVNDDFYKSFLEWQQSLPPEEQNMSTFMKADPLMEGATVPDYQAMELALERIGDPAGAVAKRRDKTALTEEAVKAGAFPEEARRYAESEYQASVTKAEKKAAAARLADIAKTTGLKVPILEGMRDTPVTPEIVAKHVEELKRNPAAANKKMQGMESVNRKLWMAIGEAMSPTPPRSSRVEEGSAVGRGAARAGEYFKGFLGKDQTGDIRGFGRSGGF